MSGSLLSIGMRALSAFQSALIVTGQNIANVNTAYYSRKSITFAEDLFGSGVNISDVSRIFDATAAQYLQDSNCSLAMSQKFFEQTSQLELLLGNQVYQDADKNDRTNNIAQFINDSLKALRASNTDVNSVQSRRLYLDKLGALSSRFNTISEQINIQYTNLNQSIQTTADQVNQLTQQIAGLNKQISSAQDSDNSSLLDQREKLLQDLAQYLDYSRQINADGKIDILMNNGVPLVSGAHAGTLAAQTDPNNPNKMTMTLTTGGLTVNVTNFIQNGKIAGYFTSQAALEQAQIVMGRISLSISQTLNAQNKLGMDYNGNLGGNIFNDINDASLVSQRLIANGSNTGSAAISVNIADVTQLEASDYKLVFDTPTHYNLTRISDQTIVSSGAVTAPPQQIMIDGISINLTGGTIVAGDTFTISPTRGAAKNMGVMITDPKLLALGWPVNAQSNPSNQGGGTINVDSITDTSNAAFSIPKQLNPPITIQFLSATTYQLVDANSSTVLEGPITYTSGAPIFPSPGGYDPGYRISISGDNIQAGDTFSTTYNINGVSDNRNGNVMERLYNTGIVAGSSMTFTQAYNLMSSDIAIQVNSAKANDTSFTAIQAGAAKRYGAITGVVLPEELQNMALYQESLQASAQIIQAAKSVFDTIIGLGR